MSDALALVLVAASWLLLVARAVNLPSSSLVYGFADNLLLVGAVLSLVAAIVWKPPCAFVLYHSILGLGALALQGRCRCAKQICRSRIWDSV